MAFGPLYCQNNGRHSKPIPLMCALLILKHLRNLSDESVVEQWSENAYCQYFFGMQEFTPCAPCAFSELVHFRNRIKSLESCLRQSKFSAALNTSFVRRACLYTAKQWLRQTFVTC